MLIITCPWCGPRNHTEFVYGADASVIRPAPDASIKEFADYVYARENPRGLHVEYWHHANGCRCWLKVTRDTLSHEITSVLPAHESNTA